MAKRILLFGREAREKVLEGAKILADAVGSTLGPKGSNVLFDRPYGPPSVIHDGVGVANEIDLIDPFQNAGAQLLKDAARKTNDAAGDGTTTATVLGYAIASEAHKNIVAGANAMIIRQGIEKSVKLMLSELDRIATPITNDAELLQVATISAQNPEIGEIVADGIKRMGSDGVLAVEESGTSQTYLEIKEGMEFNRGWIHPYFITNPELRESSYSDPYILITDLKLSSVADVIGYLSAFAATTNKENNSIIIIAEDVSIELIGIMAKNKLNGALGINIIKAPGFDLMQKEILKDMSIITGARFFSGDAGDKLSEDNFRLEDLGRAEKVVSTENNTVIINGIGKKEDIQLRIMELKNTSEKVESDFDKEKLQERIARLTDGIGVIYVGGSSSVEMKERKERFIDAISATRSAKEEGIVPGGETALIRASLVLDALVEQGDVQLGVNIVKMASKQPFRKLMQNAGYDDGRMLLELEMVMVKDNFGIDVIDAQGKDLIKSGIVDPVKVTKRALEYAASCAIMMITTDTLVVDEPKKEEVYNG